MIDFIDDRGENVLKNLSGLDDIINQKCNYERYIPNVENIINIVKEMQYKDIQAYKSLERKLVSMFFGIQLVYDDYEGIKGIIQKQYYNNSEGVDKYILQKLIFNYLSHIDSTLDYFDKFIKELKNTNVKYERKYYNFDIVINKLRNEIIHEGIPQIRVIYSDNDYESSFSCCQCVGTINLEQNHNFYLEIEINDRRLSLQELLDVTYNPMIIKIRDVMGLTN